MSLPASFPTSASGAPRVRRGHRDRTSPAGDSPNRLPELLLRAVDFLLALLVFVLPFVMGGREAWGHRFLITIALALAASWGLYAAVAGRRLTLSGFEWLFVAGLAIVWFQTQPQAPEALRQFSAEYERLLPAWSLTQIAASPAPSEIQDDVPTPTENAVGNDPAMSEHPRTETGWNTLSLLPHETRHAWWMLLSYLIVAVVTCQRLQSINDCERLLKWIGLSGVAMTLFAILQFATSNNRFFWCYRNPYTGTDDVLKGAFTNRNHFAQFLALSIGPLLWWLTKGMRPAETPAVHSGTDSRTRKLRRSTDEGTSFVQSGGVLSVPFALLLTALSLVAFCILLSLSRGGMIAAGAAFLVAMAGMWRSLQMKSSLSVVMMGGAAVVLVLLAVVGQDQIQTRVDQLVSGDADAVDPENARRAIWAANLVAFKAFPIFGTGVGSHSEVYPTYMKDLAEFPATQFSHAESTYINLLLETGAAGVSLLALGLLLLLGRLLNGFLRQQSAARKACITAVAASALGGILHAVADFIWYVPAIVVVSIVLAVTGVRACRKDDGPRGLPIPRVAWAGLTVICVMALVRVQSDLGARVESERHWYAYLKKAYDEQALAAASEYAYEETRRTRRQNLFAEILDPGGNSEATNSRIQPVSYATDVSPDDDELIDSELQVQPTDRLQSTKEKLTLLKAAVQANPAHVSARLALANRLLELFEILQTRSENPFALSQIRDAAVSSGFENRDELHDWLQRSFGDNIALAELAHRMARESLKHCPLPRDAWLTLIETDFLRDVDNSEHPQLVEQLLALRQYDPAARFVAGREAVVAQDVPAAIEHWQMVFHASPQHRLGILRLMAPQAPAAFFIELFEPNAEELQDLLAVYDALNRPAESIAVLRRLTETIPAEARLIEDDEERLQLLLLAYAASVRLEDFAFAEAHLRSLVEEFPVAYKPRHYLGLVLLQQQRFDEALAEFEWCHEHDPGNIWLPKLIVRCRRESLRAAVSDEDDPLQKFRRF